MPQWFDRLRTSIGLQEEEEQQEQTLLQQFNEATTLDRTQRAIGFVTCIGIGLLLSFMVRPSCLLMRHGSGCRAKRATFRSAANSILKPCAV
jgi:hypothetical protein